MGQTYEEEKVPAEEVKTSNVPKVEEKTGPIKYNCEVSLRMKPLGEGKSDLINADDDVKTGNKRIKGIESNTITVGNKDNDKNNKHYKCFKNIVPDSAD